MSFQHLLGRASTLTIRRFNASGAFLAEGPIDASSLAAVSAGERAPCLLLIGSEIPLGARVGDAVDVFVYLDSEGRPLATTRKPKLGMGEVAFLEVTDSASFGAFAAWGLAKDLLVPFAQQTKALSIGSFEPIGLYIDDSGRLAGTMRVSELLDLDTPNFIPGSWIDGEAWRNDPELGLFVILERRFVGLLPSTEPHRLTRGQAASFRVTHVFPDGKIELSLRAHAHEELEHDAQAVLAVLKRAHTPRVGDRSSPEQLRSLFGLSKKAFKRAAGRLLKQRLAEIDADGWLAPIAPTTGTDRPESRLMR